MALLLSSAVVIFIAFYTKSSRDFSRVTFTSGVLFASMLIPWLRAQMRVFVYWRCGNFVINELVIDDGGPMIDLPHVRRIDAARFSLVPDSSDPVALDRIGSLLRNVDRVLISCPPDRRKAWAMICKGAAIEGEVIDDTIADLDALGARLAGGRGLLLVSVGPLGLRMRALKRIFDLMIAIPAIIVCSPLLLVVALGIKLSDGGPVLFVQRRMGLGNTFFNMLKFRSMTISGSDQDGAVSTALDDARVTRVGSFIRRTSIDDLPQLFNVLVGDMSVVVVR